ncbi:MAG TPA: hypothetical protein GXZ25_09635, partial [Peptococcaceae bacterium]|nr:hypothetical protein [Peptococcaceae bacterium]
MMKKLMLKRMGTGLVLVIFLFTAVLSMAGTKLEAFAASPGDFILTHTNTDKLSPNETFTTTFKMTNLTDGDIIVSVLDFSLSGIVVPTGGESPVYTIDPDNETVPSTATNKDIGSFEFKYIGDGINSIFPVEVTYKVGAGGFETTVVNLYLNVEKPDDSGPSTPSDPSELKPNIIATVPENASLSAGKPGYINVTLKNISTASSARDILFKPVYSSESPFISVNPVTQMPIKHLGTNDSAELRLSIDTDKFSNEGLQPLNFELTYKNSRSYEITTKYTIYIKVVNFQTNCKLVLTPASSVAASAGGTFQLPLTVKNDGNLSAKDIKISLKGLSQNTFTLVSGTGRTDFERLYGNETRNLSYTLRASSSLKGGSHPITFSLTYTDEKGTVIEEEQEIWIPIAGGGGSILEVLEVKSSMTTVRPGDTFNVSVKVKNSGAYDSGQIKIMADGT